MNTPPSYNPAWQESAYPAPVDAAPARDNTTRNVLAVAAGLVVLIALLTGGLLVARSGQSSATDAQALSVSKQSESALGKPADADAAVSGATDTTVAPTADPVSDAGNGNTNNAPAPTPAPTPAPAPAPGPKPTNPPTTPPKPTTPKPVITSFITPEDIDCHNGDFQMFSASWTTTNAVKTTISIDGPGIYKTYGPNDSDSLPFSCSSPHTFLLTAFGQDGSTVTQTITLMPRNVQPPANPGDDE